MLAATIGGVGLFLLGMILLTDGLKAIAGDSLRRILLRFTRTPLKGLLSGAAITAIVQSSSATTLATIGFVGAGTLSFSQALGVIYGTNIGTTATGWLVALLGLKFSMSAVALWIVLAGALLRLFTHGRTAHVGLALAGFGVLFIGIDTLKLGMRDVAASVSGLGIPDAGGMGQIALVGIGVLLTIVTQSSSAAMVTALAALHEGTIDIRQAACLAIGANAGTTITAGVAVIGASIAAKRTALAHFTFNAVAAILVLLFLSTFVEVAESLVALIGMSDPAVALAAFHTIFNVVGVIVVFPFTRRFAALICRMIPERGPPLTRRLDPAIRKMRPAALEGARLTVLEASATIAVTLRDMILLGRQTKSQQETIEAVNLAVAEVKDYVSNLPSEVNQTRQQLQRATNTLHALDHLERLIEAITPRHLALLTEKEHSPSRQEILDILDRFIAWSASPDSPSPRATIAQLSREFADRRRQSRILLLDRSALGQLAPDETLRILDATRWLDRIGYGTWRIAEHLAPETGESPPRPEVAEPKSPT
ncbi:MAG TPA: Na/Pi symporter [Planctomycetota bacterium]|jgi:phosphate:Na+ symporter|nr:Na/Pi symporter [Planctomycetota bacterium]